MPAEYPSKTEMERRRREDPSFSDQERLSVTGVAVPSSADSRTVPHGRKVSAQLLRLARRLGKDPDELAAQIPEETLRKLRYPVNEEVTEDGKRIFKHDPGIVEGIRTLTASDGAKGHQKEPAPREHDPFTGRFL